MCNELDVLLQQQSELITDATNTIEDIKALNEQQIVRLQNINETCSRIMKLAATIEHDLKTLEL